MSDKKEFNVTATVTIEVSFDLEANSPEEAEALGKEYIEDYLHLNCQGGMVDSHKIDYLMAGEYEDGDE